MSARNFKAPALKAAYKTCRRLAAEGKFAEDASPGEMYGVMHKTYWNGRNRTGKVPEYGSVAYAAWAAGLDDRRTIERQKK